MSIGLCIEEDAGDRTPLFVPVYMNGFHNKDDWDEREVSPFHFTAWLIMYVDTVNLYKLDCSRHESAYALMAQALLKMPRDQKDGPYKVGGLDLLALQLQSMG